ncbi:MAG: phytanoyl-CoA dioxygenase family protein [Candidatus Omnitrophica bacterium]|nr:phytanoyl-CoA dioxygenase family protein [Candidatus Omnitrophota bacterium]MCB9784496.1 phytanoyl-CoA dioxygenase family protein [Candidatus Omnitrophota bacterium]
MTRTAIDDEAAIRELRGQFRSQGFCITPPIVPMDLIERVLPRMEAVVRGEYETGEPPFAIHFTPEDGPEKLKKIDQPQLCDDTILELIAHPALGEWAARIMEAKLIQAWAVQLLIKPPGYGEKGLVGWHQDKHYWPYWEGEVFTAWVALSEVTEDSGPVRYVAGSNQWGYLEGGDFFGTDDELQRDKIRLPNGAEWKEVPGVMGPGQAIFHHRHTFHGSGPNLSDKPRLSFAIHLRTEKSRPVFGENDQTSYYISNLNDIRKAPILFEES